MFAGYWESRICPSGRLHVPHNYVCMYSVCRHQLRSIRRHHRRRLHPISSLIFTICAKMSASIQSQSANSEDDDVMDDAGGNEWLDEDEDQASPEDSSSSTTGQAPADTAQGPYTRAII